MGLDIYLNWDGKTEEEQQAQLTGFDTTKGNVGYLRAAYWNSESLKIFRALWPYESGFDYDEDGAPYDFIDNYTKMEKLRKTISEDNKHTRNSLLSFFDLGVKLQQDGKNPRVECSG